MFGMSTGITFASRLKHEIRFDNKTDVLFRGFLKLLDSKSLYLDSSKKIMLKMRVGLSFNNCLLLFHKISTCGKLGTNFAIV